MSWCQSASTDLMTPQLKSNTGFLCTVPINSQGGDSWSTSLLLVCEEFHGASKKSKKGKSWSGKCKVNACEMLLWPSCGFLLAIAAPVLNYTVLGNKNGKHTPSFKRYLGSFQLSRKLFTTLPCWSHLSLSSRRRWSLQSTNAQLQEQTLNCIDFCTFFYHCVQYGSSIRYHINSFNQVVQILYLDWLE